MSKKDTGGPAFPGGAVSVGDGDTQPFSSGMTLRDWFAGQALVGAMALMPGTPQDAASIAYMAADAMLEARK